MPLSSRLVLVVAAALSVAAGRDASAQRWAGGLKAGMGQGYFTGPSEFDWQPEAYTISLFANRALTRFLSFQPEAVLTQKVGTSTVGATSLTFHADYLVLPMLTRLDLPGPSAARPYLLGGPAIVFQVRCNLRFVTAGLVSEDKCEDTPSSLNKVDVGLEGGLGLRISLGRSALVFEGRAGTNLRSEIVPLETASSRSVAWSALAGFSTPLRRPRMGGANPPQMPGAPRPAPMIAPQRMEAALPPLPSQPISETRSDTTTAAPPSQRLVSVHAVDADVRPLLIGVARQAGIDLIVANDVNRRVTLTLNNVPADAAIAAIAEAARLSLALPRQRTLPAVVYYQIPVNVNVESAETIAARFGVSVELAKFIVASKP